MREAIAAALTEDEINRLTAVLRPQVEEGRLGPARFARAFLLARKPS